jgi:ATP-binding protein involved in chromosome partitioning
LRIFVVLKEDEMSVSKEAILSALANVIEPDLKKDVVTLNLVKDIVIEDKKIRFSLELSSPVMHNKKRMEEAVLFQLKRALGEDIELEINFKGIEKKGDPSLRKILPGVKNIIAVASGKGGVGKSTVTANLAVGLAKKGYKVGLIDADVYGPSMPTMFDLNEQKPYSVAMNGKDYIEPIEAYGVKLLSIGFFVSKDEAVIWRGSMATKAINQLLSDAWWGDLDYMLIDLPPGTGDIHLTFVQTIPITGAVIITTPQEVALADARKGVSMFKQDNIKVPVLGIVENMAFFTPEELPDNKYYIFGKDGGKDLAEDLGVRLLSQIPLVQSIRESGDAGRPAILQEDTVSSKAFEELVNNVESEVNKRNVLLPPTEIVRITTY